MVTEIVTEPGRSNGHKRLRMVLAAFSTMRLPASSVDGEARSAYQIAATTPSVDGDMSSTTVAETTKLIDRPVATGTDKRVEFARIEGAVSAFNYLNVLGLQNGFGQNVATYFRFSESSATVRDVDSQWHGHGEQKGRCVLHRYFFTVIPQWLNDWRRSQVYRSFLRARGAAKKRFLLMAGFVSFTVFAPFANADCIDDAAFYFRLDPHLVRAIAMHESGMRANALNRNANGSVDIGLMQINSSWLSTLERAGISPESLWNACVNAYVGVWILSNNIARFGATWKAVGAYNAASPDKQLRYANQIYAQWQSIRQHIQVAQRP